MSFEKSAYAILGISKASSEPEIKQAYVALVKKYDPEKHTERFMVIQQAYDRLRVTKTRATEDVFTLNIARGDYLFTDEEKSHEDAQPDEARIAKLRASFLENGLDETKKTEFCTALFQRAHYLTRRKQYSDAIRDWGEVLEHEPSHSRARHNLELACASLGISYAFHGLSEESIELLERALNMNPDNSNLVHNLALIAEQAKDAERATKYWESTVQHWKQKLNKEPENDEYLRSLIVEALNHQTDLNDERWMHQKSRRSSETIVNPLSKGASTAPSREKKATLSTPARTARAKTEEKTASAPPTRAANTPPPPAASSSSTSVPTSSFDQGTLDRMREIIELNPTDYDAHFQLCNKLVEQQLWVEAQNELQKLLKKNQKNTEAWNLLGWAYLNDGKKDKGFSSWKRSLVIDPKNPSTREQLVRAHISMGKAFRNKGIFTQALVHFKQLLSLMPRSAEVHLEIAATYDMKGDVRSAAQEYEQVLKLDPKCKVARKALNDLRMKG